MVSRVQLIGGLFGLCLCLLVTAACHRERSVQTAQEAQETADSLFGGPLPHAAHETFARYIKAVNAGEVARTEEIPERFWTEEIRDLEPVRVYTHRVNIVVVQEVSDNAEKGLYIYIPISSYIPMGNDDGFEFSTGEGNVHKFTRTLTD